MNINNHHRKIYKLEDKEKTEPDTICEWCEKPVDAWDQYAQDQSEAGMHIWRVCPHCGESKSENDLLGCAIFIILTVGFIYAMVTWNNWNN